MTIALHDRLRKSPGITPTTTNPDGSMTLGTSHGDLVELNTTAAALWALCDGQTQIAEIVSAAANLFTAPQATIEREVVAVLDDLLGRGLLVG